MEALATRRAALIIVRVHGIAMEVIARFACLAPLNRVTLFFFRAKKKNPIKLTKKVLSQTIDNKIFIIISFLIGSP